MLELPPAFIAGQLSEQPLHPAVWACKWAAASAASTGPLYSPNGKGPGQLVRDPTTKLTMPPDLAVAAQSGVHAVDVHGSCVSFRSSRNELSGAAESSTGMRGMRTRSRSLEVQ